MTDTEFIQKHQGILSEVPPEFHSALSKLAWDRGHSGGNNEIICVLEDLVGALQKPIQNFEERIRAEVSRTK